jgi:hypothetical protein
MTRSSLETVGDVRGVCARRGRPLLIPVPETTVRAAQQSNPVAHLSCAEQYRCEESSVVMLAKHY